MASVVFFCTRFYLCNRIFIYTCNNQEYVSKNDCLNGNGYNNGKEEGIKVGNFYFKGNINGIL
jgi:hypothetical protein